MSNYYLTKEDCLKHHGIKGQKWGLRNFQYPDGTYTELGKARRRKGESDSVRIGNREISKSTLKKVAKAAIAIGTVAAAAAYVKKHPETIAKVVAKASSMAVSDLGPKLKEAGKVAVKQVVQGAKDGLREAPYKVTKAVVGGAAILAANKLVENAIGKEQNANYIKAYNAYNKKNKIGSLPNVFSKQDEEDE